MAKKIQPNQIINTNVDKILSAVTRDIAKDFETSNFAEQAEQTYLSTGVAGINYAISSRFDGGFPEGLITEIFGENSTGKSLLALHALVETERKGGIAVLIDAEFAFNPAWYKVLGGDPEQLIHYEPDYIDQVYDFTKRLVYTTRAKDKEIPITVVYDSVAASPSKFEFEGAEFDMGKRAQAHGKGLRMLMGLCKKQNITFIAINQLRHTFNMYGLDKDTTGGQQWKYAPSVRLRLRKGKKIDAKTDLGKKTVGIHGSLKVEKSRLGPPFAEADFDIYFKEGIDPQSGLFDVLVGQEIIEPRRNDDGKVVKGWWTYKDTNFQKTNFDGVLEEYPELLGGHTRIAVPEDTEISEDGDDDFTAEADM